MRLTLRTLLAYLDDILDPSDREELTNKIETSDFANDLIHRTRDTMRRLRLSAPQPVGTGMALDPNTVAEYLDNVLPPDAVGDFERICLESDVHLAEVASCHHVLTMVLGEPAAIDPDTKQRMYSLATEVLHRKRLRVEPGHISPTALGTEAEVDAVSSLAATSVPRPAAGPVEAAIPDYLRASAWSRMRGILLFVTAALLLSATVYFALGLTGWFASGPPAVASGNAAPQPFSSTDTIRPEMSSDDQLAAADTQSGQPGDSSEPLGGGADLAEEGAAPAPAGSTPPRLLTPGMAARPNESTPQPVESTDSSLSTEAMAPATMDSPYQVPSETPDRYGESSGTDAAPANGAPSPLRLPAIPTEGVEPTADQPSQDAAADDGMRVASAVVDTPASATPGSHSGMDVAAPPAPPEPDPVLGTYLGGKNVLLRFDQQQGSWFRLTPRTTVEVGDKLLALPVYRPRITLASGVDLELIGGTQIKLATAGSKNDESDAQDTEVPRIEVVYGRVVLVNVDTTTEENRLQLAFGTTVGDVRLAPNATLAVEVQRVYVPGRDPRQTPSPVVASLYAPNGNVVWTDDLGTRSVDDPGRWTVSDGTPTAIAADHTSPEWIDRDPVELLSEQRHGAPVIEQSLVLDRPIDNQLLELYQGSGRREVKSLAARCSVHVGQFVPFIEALRDSDQKAVWKIHVETLRSAMALSPESAESIYRTLVEQRGERAAADLYEMLCGYDEDQIGHTQQEREVGAIAHLIDRLEDDNLDYRVLAVHNLREITGKSLMPNPAGSPNEREQGIRHWRSRLKAGELGPKTQP